jgi:dihydroorotase
LLTDKDGTALTAASGMPSIQFSLVAMLQLVDEGLLPIELVVQKMCHAPALLFHIDRRGFIRKGFKADLVLVRKDSPWEPTRASILSKCG